MTQDLTDQPAAAAPDARVPRVCASRLGLSGKLLLLTILFVMLAEVLIYVPSIASFRVGWLNDRLSAANTAALVFEAVPRNADGQPIATIPDSLVKQVLDSIGARAVALKTGQTRRLLAIADMPPPIDQDIDMRTLSWHRSVFDAFDTMLSTDNDVIRVIGPAPMGGEFVEVVLDEAPLRRAMLTYSGNILLVSLLVSGITAMLVYLTLHHLFVRPLRRITANMVAFHGAPENPANVIVPSTRHDEVGTAERELAAMQSDLAGMLQQKSRLAALGLAVSKINHDLRNLLTTAQLFSDRLASVPDPRVQRFAPKILNALERAIAFAESTLSYGRAQEQPPDRRLIALEPLVDEVRETLGLDGNMREGVSREGLVREGSAREGSPHDGLAGVRWVTAVERGLMVDADPDQLFRILLNLARNAVQAFEGSAARHDGSAQVRVTGRREGAVVVIEVSDTGPGIPAQAREHLFEAFQGSTRTGGSGLGLAISAELIRAHGGEIRLVDGTLGATFRLTIPDRAIDLRTRRGERQRA